MRTAILLLVVLALSLGASAQTANLWVDTNGGTCTRQATPATYVDAAACSSMQAAQTAASAGDTIRIKNGTYGSQSISSGGKANYVNFYAETAGSVLVGGLSISVDYVKVTGVIGSGTGNSRGSLTLEGNYILIDGFHGSTMSGAWNNLATGKHDWTIQNCEFGGNDTALYST